MSAKNVLENKIVRFLLKLLISIAVFSFSVWVVIEMENDVEQQTGGLVVPILVSLQLAKFLIVLCFLLVIFSKENNQ